MASPNNGFIVGKWVCKGGESLIGKGTVSDVFKVMYTPDILLDHVYIRCIVMIVLEILLSF
jgi:hypothetical protein